MTFQLIESHDLPDIQSVGHLYKHDETGAKVLYLANDDKNKAFTIAFKTPPYSDNGITHILEHSVLNGSAKYPSKEPFVELIKGSLNTFVNAMTFSDKTIYPVASTNDQDFKNLVGVYLDAVFEPKLYDDPQILEQEGWHYHLEQEGDDLIYKGVVYNEMKGATASADRQLMMQVQKHLYDDTLYRHESGGLPSAIPDLTQEEFIAYHEKHYHPSNSLTILYGDLDLEASLEQLEEYFSGKGRQEETIDLSIQAKEPSQTSFHETYSLTAGDDPHEKDYLALAWHVTTPADSLDAYGLLVLEEILFGSNQAPLKKALLAAEIGGDIEGNFDEIGYPGAFIMIAKYTTAAKLEAFQSLVDDTLSDLVSKGLEASLVTAAINKITFNLKENAISESNPRGVIYAISVLSSWLYEASPYPNLEFTKYLQAIKAAASEGYFEDLIQRKFLDNPIRLSLALTAQAGKNDALENQLHQELQARKAKLNDSELKKIVTNTQALLERQVRPDKAEDLAKIPSLSRADLSADVEEIPFEVRELAAGKPYYFAEQFTSGIDYVNLYFDISDLPQTAYQSLALFSRLLGNLATANYSVAELQNLLDTHTGGIQGKIMVYQEPNGEVKPYFVLKGKALAEASEQLFALMKEIISLTQFTDTDEILNLVQSTIADFEQMIDFNSHAIAANRALSHINRAAKLAEATGGIDQYRYLLDIRKALKAQDTETLIAQMNHLQRTFLNQERIALFYIGQEERAETIKQATLELLSDFPSQAMGAKATYYPGRRENEAFVTAQDVNYVALAIDAKEAVPFNGVTKVLATVLRYDYLWNEIRVKGGAYGAKYGHQRQGEIFFSSYRDPNISKTYATYAQLPDYLRELDLSDAEILKYIIGSLSPLDQPLSANAKGQKAMALYQTGLSHRDEKTMKEEILNTNLTDLKALQAGIAQAYQSVSKVVIGNKQQIEQETDLFDQTYDLF